MLQALGEIAGRLAVIVGSNLLLNELGGKGLAWIRVEPDGGWQSPIAKFLSDDERALIAKRTAAKPAAGGEKAVEFLRENPQNLVILDMVMPEGIDGAETYRKALKINLSQKAIIVSGFAESERVEMALKLGAGTYIRMNV